MPLAFVATTFPTLVPPEPPPTVLQWAGVFWFALPVLLVLALIWAVFRRRASRWLKISFNLVALLSIIVLAAAAAISTRDYPGARQFFEWPLEPVSGIRPIVSVQDDRLYIGFMTAPSDSGYVNHKRYGFGYLKGNALTDTSSHAGFVKVGTIRQVVAPLWAVMVLAGLTPAAWLVRRVLVRRGQEPGLCPNCGYDLRATPERCPECGAVPVVAK